MSDYEAANSVGKMHSSVTGVSFMFLLKMWFSTTTTKLFWKASTENNLYWCRCFGKAAVPSVIAEAES